ncbi:SOSS complex subunit [Dirofilaria immitis]
MSGEIVRPNSISQLMPNMKNVNLTFIVLDIGQSRRTPQGHDVRTIRVADPTGSVLMGVWNDVGDNISAGDIWRLRNGFTTIFKEVPNMSEYNAEYAAKFPSNRKGSPDDETTGSGQGGNGNVQRSHSTAAIHRPLKRPVPSQGQFRRDSITNKSARNS